MITSIFFNLELATPSNGPPDGGGDGGDSGGDEGASPLGTDEDPPAPRHAKPNGDPDSSGDSNGHGFRGRKPVSTRHHPETSSYPQEFIFRRRARSNRSGNCGP